MTGLYNAFSDRYLARLFKTSPSVLKSSSQANSFLASSIFQEIEKKNILGGKSSLLVIAPGNQEAESLASEASLYLPENQIAFFPSFDAIPYEFAGIPAEAIHQRLRLLYRLLAGERLIVFASIDAVVRRLVPPERLKKARLLLEAGKRIEPRTFAEKLIRMGYERTDRVDVPGDFCLKGALLDVFPLNESIPVRFDFFDDEIENIRLFDPDTQISKEKIMEAEILPAGEIILSPDETEKLKKNIDSTFKSDLARPLWWEEMYSREKSEEIISQLHHPGIDDLIPALFELSSFEDYFSEKPFRFFSGYDSVMERLSVINREYSILYEKEAKSRVCLSPEKFLISGMDFFKNKNDFYQNFNISADEEIEKDMIVLPVKKSEGFSGRLREIRKFITEKIEQGSHVCITSPYTAQLNRMAGIFRDEQIETVIFDNEKENFLPDVFKPNTVYLIRSNQREGFSIPEMNFFLWTDSDIFGRSYRRRNRFKTSQSSSIESFLDLKEKDYVVHVHHGIGRFLGLERVEAAGRERDFLVLEYADDDKLFVPLDQISLVQKYIASTESPKLDSLGKASFKKIRERVEKKVEEFAEDLLKIYAVRMSQKGFSYPPDTVWQDEFEADFPFEETPDQISAIEAAKQDMESPRPMDRLICGDVGYGKTEVAIRTAFKAVMAGRQVAFICPTTILALQHFRNLSERFKNFPIRVDWISRFRSRSDITAIKKELLHGEIDIVIGTHSLLSKDIHIKNLGLLIIDEEQRFGVVHKESIKRLRKLIDVITLSATPIPRTLHMSLVGIRDLSVIQTPPRDRLPVRTYVMEDSDAILVEAIQREIERDGQIFFLHNRVDSIEAAAGRIKTLFPDLNIAVLHGQMHDEDIEDILMDFLEKRYEVLVTTSIIESGIDMPNVNTLIIDRADTFGLSQLYQIRGRVGRANRQAYAYLFYPDHKSLTELAQKRLNTIMEYQDLGSGFKVAMRDLEIRGAGNVLGKEQSGDIMEVGYELYIKLLESAIKRLRGEKIEHEVRCSINLNTDFYLPDDYISDVRQRIEFYKRLEAARTDEEVEKISSEMKDRFGELPEAAQIFVKVEKIRALASLAGFDSVYQEDSGRIHFKASEYFRVPPQHLIATLQSGLGLYVTAGKKDTLFFESKKKEKEEFSGIINVLKKLTEPVLQAEALSDAAKKT